MKILDRKAFVLSTRGDLGIAGGNTFASMAWKLSDEAFNTMGGSKFDWIAPDGQNYTEHRDAFTRPTDEQIMTKMSISIKLKALELNLIQP